MKTNKIKEEIEHCKICKRVISGMRGHPKYHKTELCTNCYNQFRKSNLKWFCEKLNLVRKQATADFKENNLLAKTNHQLGCMLECYEQVIANRIGFEKEAKQLMEIASKLK